MSDIKKNIFVRMSGVTTVFVEIPATLPNMAIGVMVLSATCHVQATLPRNVVLATDFRYIRWVSFYSHKGPFTP